MKDFLRTADLSSNDLEHLLDVAATFKANPTCARDTFSGRTVVLYFAKPSTRTRLSFETAVVRLGGAAVAVGPAELQLGRGETIEDTARVVSSYAAAMTVRTYADEDVRRLAAAASIPIVNALTDGHHPCQSLADLLTLRDRFGALGGLRVAYVGDGNNVAHSLIEACAIAGADIVVATPEHYEPDPAIVAHARAVAARRNSIVAVTHDATAAVEHAHAVYTDVWLSMGDEESERDARRTAFAPFRVDAHLMASARPDAVFLHCLPAHRGQEVSAEVIDGSQSMVFEQAANRLPTEMAVLYALDRGELDGARAEAREVSV